MRRTRRRKHRGSEPSDPRQKALDLIELAIDRSTTEDERRSAAVRAVEYIDRHDLLRRPFEHNEKVRKFIDVADQLSEMTPNLVTGLKDIVDLGSGFLDRQRQRRR